MLTFGINVMILHSRGYRRQFRLVVQALLHGRSSVTWSAHACVAGEVLHERVP